MVALMDGLTFQLGAMALAGLASAAAAWLLQWAMPRVHPVLTAGIVLILLILLDAIVAGVLIVRTLAIMGAEGRASIDTQGAFAASTYIFRILEFMCLIAIGLPVAIVTAFARRRRDRRRTETR